MVRFTKLIWLRIKYRVMYGYDDIDKIVEFKTWKRRKKIDELFRIDSWMYTNLGSESTTAEKDAVEASEARRTRAQEGGSAREAARDQSREGRAD